MTLRPHRVGAAPAAFTIVELLVATVVFSGLLLILAVTTNQTAEVWRRGAAKVEQFQGARRGFESMTRRMSQATLNTYFDYDYELSGSGTSRKLDVSKPPLNYSRQSELRFRSGPMEKLAPEEGVFRPTHGVFFQAPLGLVDDEDVLEFERRRLKPLGDLLNSWGYFIEVGTDEKIIPRFLKDVVPPRIRSRLMQFMEPTERVQLDDPSATPDEAGKFLLVKNENWDLPWNGWFTGPLKRKQDLPVRVLSENIIALVILPRLSQQDEAVRVKRNLSVLTPFYDYDSKRNSNRAAAIADPLNPKIKGDPKDGPEAVNPKNQLPPVVTVAMVAIDEMAAERLKDRGTKDDLTLGLKWEGLFEDAKKLDDDPTTKGDDQSGDGDLYKLEQQLLAKKINYRVYTSNVTIRGAKWSRAQK